MTVNRVATSKKVISGETINTLLSGKGAEERNNGPCSAQQKLLLLQTNMSKGLEKKKENWFSGLVKLI